MAGPQQCATDFMAAKIIILAGAPVSSSLDWDGPDLLTQFQEPLAQLAGLEAHGSFGPSTWDSSDGHAVWRAVPLEAGHLPTGFSQFRHAAGGTGSFTEPSAFFNMSFTSAGDEGDAASGAQELISEFYEHSLAVHDETLSRSGSSAETGTEQSTSNDPSSADNVASFLSDGRSQDAAEREVVSNGLDCHLSDLEDIPPASYLYRIQPQTMSVNLIVGIISIAEPRVVRTRWGSSSTLVEVLIGDETKAGFAVTFWLPSTDPGGSVLAGLRVQDVVLLQNVALNVFKGKVYGSSLRKNLTRVHLLYRRRIDQTDPGGYYKSSDLASPEPAHPQLEKTKKVWSWVLNFVGGPGHGATAKRSWDHMPEDTQ
ncbi:hypothetical protein VTK73DRAFT_9702 [Phialemonium thermophilum]|uniref:Uncharacterized protein n=1 Tax=Phialemonium thermophilum TaxID=223376 RepID=A0ABR3W0Q4_9PEZI